MRILLVGFTIAALGWISGCSSGGGGGGGIPCDEAGACSPGNECQQGYCVAVGGSGGGGGGGAATGGGGGLGGGSAGVGGGAAGMGGGTAGTGGGTAGTGGGSGTCNVETCPTYTAGGILPVPACCSPNQKCGSQVDSTIASALGGVPPGCYEANQPGSLTTVCPPWEFTSPLPPNPDVAWMGCCTPAGKCGYYADLTVEGGPNVGCQEATWGNGQGLTCSPSP